MKENKNLFIKIDEFIFQKIDLLKSDGTFQRLNDLIGNLEEDQQKILAQVSTFILILFPFIISSFLWWGNYKIKKNLEIKSQILEQMSTFNGNKDALLNISSSYLSNPIPSQEELENKITNIKSSHNIDQSKVQIINFSQLTNTSTLIKIEAILSFQKFGTIDFSNFMRTLVEEEKFKIIRVDLHKDKNSSLLNGEMTLMHLGRNTTY